MIFDVLRNAASSAISHLYQTTVHPEQVLLQETSAHFEGDVTLVLFPFLKISGKSPAQTGEEIGTWLMEKLETISGFQIVKGFLNITLRDDFWISFLQETSRMEKYGMVSADPSQKPVVVEFSSPNTNKPLHLGHIRNNLLGAAISNILEASGNRVIRVNLVNDRGIHICKSMLGWMKFAKGITPEMAGIKGDRFVGDYYVAFDKAYKAEISKATAKGASQEEAEGQSIMMEEAREMLRQWEEGQPEVKELWHQMNEWVYQGFDTTYKRLGIRFDKIYYESDTYLKGKEVVLQGVKDGALITRDDGSVWIDLRSGGLDEKLLLRADGTSVYMTQDLGTAILRDDEFHPSLMMYVVGNEQNYHFDVLVKVLEKLNHSCYSKIRHLSYGMVELPSGRMKSREGTVVDADDLMDEMKMTAARVTSELGKWSPDELKELDPLFETLGLGALKYFILKVDPKKNMLFNPDESIDFNGNTGPFIQYTHARIASLASKALAAGIVVAEPFPSGTISLESEERSLLRTLYRWPMLLEESSAMMNPAMVANYAYELAKEFNQFYHVHSVLGAPEPHVRSFRVALSSFTGNVLKISMGLLGITLPDRM